MSHEAPATPGAGRRVFGFLLITVLFALAYCQAPLYYSNQNQYFLHGLAHAGYGQLQEDWLANTADPTPLFSTLVTETVRWLHPGAFYVYHALLMGIYAVALVGLFAWLAGDMAARRWLVFLALLVAVHSGAARWGSYRLFGQDYPWHLQAGVAGQYVLGGMLQPSVFGVLLVLAIVLFARGQDFLAIACAVLGATIHSTYLLPAALLTAGCMTALAVEGRFRRAVGLGAMALVLVLPVTVYVLLSFRPSSADTFAKAQEILVHVRIPHHCVPRVWLDTIARLQIAWIVLGALLSWRTRLFPVLAVVIVLASSLSVVQVATGSDTLALLFPWRISAVLMPVATALVLTRLLAIRPLPVDGPAVSFIACLALVGLAAAGVFIMAERQAFRTGDEEISMMDHVRSSVAPGEVYLVPVKVPNLEGTIRGSTSGDFKPLAVRRSDTQLIPLDLQRFRLYTGAPIYVDFKSIPYKDEDVVAWYERLTQAEALQAQLRKGRIPDVLAELRRRGITHIVAPADVPRSGPGLERTYADDFYHVYRLTP